MVNKKRNFIFGIAFLLSILLIALVSAQEVSYCCEQTKAGAWCQNAPQDECKTTGDLRAVPTSCEATSYCKTGTCVNTAEGICFENTPRKVCENPEGGESGGVWYDSDSDEIPLCQLGCCLIGDQAAFVTQTRCQQLSSYYGLEINFRTDIRDELTCIASATPKAKGACVFETSTGRTCTFITKSECQDMKSGNPSADFHQGLLCSNPSLGADCSSSSKTTCVEGRDEVYFLDTCGNLANVYDASKINNVNYWSEIQAPTCNPDNPKDCGDCNYYAGTTCGEFRSGVDTRPSVGNNVCRDLGCKEVDKNHGETWCAEAKGVSKITVTGGGVSSSGEDLPGGRYFRMVCYNGEVSVEPCADYRQEVCIQSEVNTFRTAACRVNIWRDCYSQNNIKDCENSDKRDCKVVEGFNILKDENGESLFEDEDGNKIEASCVPKYAPGFDFWESGGDAESMCSMANAECLVQYEAGFFDALGGGKGEITFNEECKKRCEDAGESDCEKKCMPKCAKKVTSSNATKWELDLDSWADNMNEMCIAIGDCGSSINYVGAPGYYEPSDFITRSGEENEED